MKQLEGMILSMRKAGKSRQEIADALFLEKKQIVSWVTRYNRAQASLLSGGQCKPKGRPRKDGQPPRQSEKSELERLRMENQLLRDFLQFTGKGCGQG